MLKKISLFFYLLVDYILFRNAVVKALVSLNKIEQETLDVIVNNIERGKKSIVSYFFIYILDNVLFF